MKIVRIVFALGLIVIASTATAQIKKVLADKIIATVGDKYILRSDVDNALADYKRQAQGQENIELPSACQVIEGQLIRKALVLQAEKDSILITEEEIEVIPDVEEGPENPPRRRNNPNPKNKMEDLGEIIAKYGEGPDCYSEGPGCGQ